MTSNFLDSNTAQELEFLLWGLTMVGVFSLIVVAISVAKYLYKELGLLWWWKP
jgi:hypothetical protein